MNNVVSEKVVFVVTSYVRFALSCFIYEKMKFKVIVYVALQLEFDRKEVYEELNFKTKRKSHIQKADLFLL